MTNNMSHNTAILAYNTIVLYSTSVEGSFLHQLHQRRRGGGRGGGDGAQLAAQAGGELQVRVRAVTTELLTLKITHNISF